MLVLKQHESYVIDNMEMFNRLKTYCSKISSEFLTFDVETDSVIEKTTRLFGLGICLSDSKAFYICWRNSSGEIIWSDAEQVEIISWFYELCKVKKLIAHNGIFDVLVIFNNWNIDITDYLYFDTILAAHCIAEDGVFALKELGKQWFGEEAVAEQNDLKDSVLANGGKWLKSQKDMYLADTGILAKYCAKDVILTLNLFRIYEQKLKEENLENLFYIDEVMPLMKEVLIPAKKYGFPIDVDHFNKLKVELEDHLLRIEEEIVVELKEDVKPFITKLLDKEVPVKSSGMLPKFIAKEFNIPIPTKVTKNKETGEVTEKITMGAKEIQKQLLLFPQFSNFYNWILGTEELTIDKDILWNLREKIYIERKNNLKEIGDTSIRYSFNLASADHLSYYFFEVCKYEIKDKTPTGKAKINIDFLEELKADNPTAQKIIDFKKLSKILGTYVNGLLDRQINGKIYTSLLAHGTTSGRLASRNPNCQNLPRPKDEESNLSPLVLSYVNEIRAGFAVPEGYKLIDNDYSQLEPCCFATMSGDKKLQDIFHQNLDLYSKIAIDTFGMTHLSANKKDPNYLKNVSPEFRAKAKVFCLAVVYGAEEARISQAMSVDFKEAAKVIKSYLDAYPELKKYMADCEKSVKKEGKVSTIFGRVRHLPEAKRLFEKYGNELLDWKWAKSKNLLRERREFKLALNNAKNTRIQGLAAHIVNRASIAIMREFKKLNLFAYIGLQVHDQLIVICLEHEAEIAAKIVQDCMENTTKIAVPLVAIPQITTNLRDGH